MGLVDRLKDYAHQAKVLLEMVDSFPKIKCVLEQHEEDGKFKLSAPLKVCKRCGNVYVEGK